MKKQIQSLLALATLLLIPACTTVHERPAPVTTTTTTTEGGVLRSPMDDTTVTRTTRSY